MRRRRRDFRGRDAVKPHPFDLERRRGRQRIDGKKARHAEGQHGPITPVGCGDECAESLARDPSWKAPSFDLKILRQLHELTVKNRHESGTISVRDESRKSSAFPENRQHC
jgi:hypothetical protein